MNLLLNATLGKEFFFGVLKDKMFSRELFKVRDFTGSMHVWSRGTFWWKINSRVQKWIPPVPACFIVMEWSHLIHLIPAIPPSHDNNPFVTLTKQSDLSVGFMWLHSSIVNRLFIPTQQPFCCLIVMQCRWSGSAVHGRDSILYLLCWYAWLSVSPHDAELDIKY